MSKVPLHVYDKVMRRKKVLDWIGNALSWSAGVIVVGVIVFLVGVIVWGVWTAGFGVWIIGIGTVLALLVWYGITSSNDKEVLEQARREGIIDE